MVWKKRFHTPGHCARVSPLFFRTVFAVFLLFISTSIFAEQSTDLETGIDRPDELGRSILMRALWQNRNDLVLTLLRHGADTEVKDINGQTALYMALQFTKDIEIVKTLLEAGARVNTLDKRGRSPMEILINRGKNPEYARLLVERGVTPVVGSGGESLYFSTLKRSHPEDRILFLKALFEAGFSLNDRNRSGRTPREEALFTGDPASADILTDLRDSLCEALIQELDENGNRTDTNTLEELLNRGALPSYRNHSGYNACHYAVAAGRPDLLRILLNRTEVPPFADDPPELQNLILQFPLDYDQEIALSLLELLLGQGMNPDMRDDAGFTLLARGIAHSAEVAQLLLRHGADPNRLDPGGLSPLMTALTIEMRDKTALLKALVHAGADLKVRDDQGWDILTYAILYRNSSNVISTLIDLGVNPDNRDEYGTPGFFWAAAYGEDLQLIRSLIPSSIKASWQDKDGWTPLMGALYFGNSPEVVSYLAGLSPDGRVSDGSGRDLRMYSEYYGNHFFKIPGKLDQLIERTRVFPADAVPYGNQLDTALAEVLRWGGDPAVASELLKAGADPDVTSSAGFSGISAAAAFNSSEMVKTMVDGGASVFSVTPYGWTPLHVAAWSSDPGTAELLIREGLDVNVCDFDNWTPLMWAARNGATLEYLKTLFSFGADSSIQSYGNNTALHLACSAWTRPKPGVLELLLNSGIQVNHVNHKGETALILAASMGYDRACTILLERGADPQIKDLNGENASSRALSGGFSELSGFIDSFQE